MGVKLVQMWQEDEGVLSFEWTLLITVLTIGVVSGMAGARDAIIDELGDFAQAAVAVDQSFTVANPLLNLVHDRSQSEASDSGYIDSALYQDCTRLGTSNQQLVSVDIDS